jgi:hypothetical protein
LRREDDFLRLLDDDLRLRELPLLRLEREELERVDELLRVPRCDEPLRELDDERRRELPERFREEPLRLRLDRFVAAIEI